MKNKRTLLIIILVAVAVVIAIGAIVAVLITQSGKDRVFKSDEMTITLTNGFRAGKDEDLDAYYYSKDIDVMIKKDDKSTLEELKLDPDMSERKYAELIANGIKSEPKVKKDNGLVYFEYINSANGVDYKFYACVFETEEAFWFVQFGATVEKYSANREDIVKYAKSIVFAE